MKRAVLLISALVLGACRSLPDGSVESVEDGVRATLTLQEAAWNRGDLEGFMAGYWRSPALVFFSQGDRTEGWQPTLERYRKRYRSADREMGRLTFGRIEILALDSGAAMARGTWRLDFERTDPRHSEGLFTLILRRFPEGWRIVHDHTSAAES